MWDINVFLSNVIAFLGMFFMIGVVSGIIIHLIKEVFFD